MIPLLPLAAMGILGVGHGRWVEYSNASPMAVTFHYAATILEVR